MHREEYGHLATAAMVSQAESQLSGSKLLGYQQVETFGQWRSMDKNPQLQKSPWAMRWTMGIPVLAMALSGHPFT